MNAKYLKRVILEEIRNVLNEGDEDVAKSMDARVREKDEVGDNASDIAYRAIGFLVGYQISKPNQAAVANQGITELQQFMKNTQTKLGKAAQYSYDFISKAPQEDKNYYFNISKQFHAGGLKAAQAYIQKFSGEDKKTEEQPSVSSAPKTPGPEVAAPYMGAKTNPAPDIFRLKDLARASPDFYKGKIAYYYGPNRVLKQIQF